MSQQKRNKDIQYHNCKKLEGLKNSAGRKIKASTCFQIILVGNTCRWHDAAVKLITVLELFQNYSGLIPV